VHAKNDARVGATPTFTRETKQATMEDRKRQMSQLAAMGVAVPGELLPDLALAGEWTVVSEKVVGEKPLSMGVHKRKLEDLEEEAREKEAEIITRERKKGWGNNLKSFPGKRGGGEEGEVEALFKMVGKRAKREDEGEDEVKKEEVVIKGESPPDALHDIPTAEEAKSNHVETDVPLKEEEEAASMPTVVFKKRKKIAR
jgi:hypothetical protein